MTVEHSLRLVAAVTAAMTAELRQKLVKAPRRWYEMATAHWLCARVWGLLYKCFIPFKKDEMMDFI